MPAGMCTGSIQLLVELLQACLPLVTGHVLDNAA